VDYESLEKHDVTVRDRDTKEQVRVPVDTLASYLQDKLKL
jgi:glycyl-tRNA synthetase